MRRSSPYTSGTSASKAARSPPRQLRSSMVTVEAMSDISGRSPPARSCQEIDGAPSRSGAAGCPALARRQQRREQVALAAFALLVPLRDQLLDLQAQPDVLRQLTRRLRHERAHLRHLAQLVLDG